MLQVVLDDHIGDGIEDELDVIRVRGAGEVRVDLLLVFPLVEIFKLHANVVGRLLEGVGTCEKWVLIQNPFRFDSISWLLTCVFGEAYRQGRSLDLLLKQILLVEEKYYGGFHKPLGVADGIEQLQGLDHAIHLLILGQDQVVALKIERQDNYKYFLYKEANIASK